MTDQQITPSPHFTSPNDATSPKDAKAQAKTETALRSAPRPWLKRMRFMLPLALVLLMLIVQAVNGGIGTGITRAFNRLTQPAATSASTARPPAPGVGTKVRDGKFAFVVTGVERPGKTLAGKSHTTLTARGEFVIVRVKVTNLGDEAQAPDCSCQILLNGKGEELKPSAAILSTKEALKFVQLIEPGDTVSGVLLLFDVAKGAEAVAIELHASPDSPGAKVTLS